MPVRRLFRWELVEIHSHYTDMLAIRILAAYTAPHLTLQRLGNARNYRPREGIEPASLVHKTVAII